MIRILFPAFACAATMALAHTGDLIPVTYLCERGVEVPVVFVNPEGGDGYAVAQIDGKLLGMRQAVSASGARYRSGDGADAYQLWSKGNGALIFFGAEGQESVLFQDCTARE